MGVMTRLLLLLWAGVALSTAVDLHKRIINGSNCEQAERWFHVKLTGSNGTRSNFCGGSLINNSWILTAAHCLHPGWTMTAYLGIHPGNAITVEQITHNETFRDSSGEHDIMLLRLPNPTNIQPVALPNCTAPPPVGNYVRVAGFGPTYAFPNGTKGRIPSNTLQCLNINVTTCNCVPPRDPVRPLVYPHLICGDTFFRDTAPGDSGGGVVYPVNGQPMIYGVHVFSGVKVCTSQAGFMDVCRYIDWINRIINTP